MPHFFLRLNGPRPTFPADITDAERAVMSEHGVYWRGLTDQGKSIVFGPVLDPRGVFGMAVVEVANEAEARALADGDPTTRAKLGSWDVLTMPVATVRR
jgi:uncharacterized protein YciI